VTGIARAVAEFELTPEDWEDVNAVHLFESRLHREQLGRVRGASALLFVTLALLTLLLGFGSGALMFGAAALIFPVFVGPMQRRAQRQALRKLTAQGIANGTFGHHTVEVRDEGLFHSTHAYESLFRWHAIDRVKEKDGNFLVYIGPNAFLPIPATAFPDSAALRRFADAFYERKAEPPDLPPESGPAKGLFGSGHQTREASLATVEVKPEGTG
jgi:hypothetical protein